MLENGQTEITVKLLSSGRYIWNISYKYMNENTDEAIQKIKMIDSKLKNQFPDFVKRGNARTLDLGEE